MLALILSFWAFALCWTALLVAPHHVHCLPASAMCCPVLLPASVIFFPVSYALHVHLT